MKGWIRWTALVAVVAGGGGLASLTLLTPSPATCHDDPALCRPQQTRADIRGYLRAVSLDLRGIVPTVDEYATLDEGADAEAAAAALVDEWLETDAFADRATRRHRELLWPNISNVTRLFHFRRNLTVIRSNDIWYQSSNGTRLTYRDASVSCLDEPATFDSGGAIVTREVDGVQREGYVMVRPYWDMSTEIKVCAFDAQTAAVSPSGSECSTRDAVGDAGCGCGPNLRWCSTGAFRSAVLESFAAEMERRISAHIQADEPYHELFTSRRAFVNGPLSYFWQYHRDSFNNVQLTPAAISLENLPSTALEGGTVEPGGVDEWTEIELPEEHSGLLTHPVFLLRFQTNRARAARFYDAFLCEPFQAPEGGIPLDDEVAAAQPDVQQRPGCNYCHAILEPAAAHWGRWTQQGGGFLDPATFPEFRQECQDCGRALEPCSDLCRFNYVTRAFSPEEEPFLGTLRAFQFLRDEHREFVEQGPSELIRAGLSDGRFTSCSVRRTAEWLVGRSLTEEEGPWLRELSDSFLDSEFRYRELVRAVVSSDTYRRAL